MTATQNASDSGAARLGASHRRPTEVVAGLVNDGSALPVAAAAVREAVRRRLPVRVPAAGSRRPWHRPRLLGRGGRGNLQRRAARTARPPSDAQHLRARHRRPRHPGRGSQPWRRRPRRRRPPPRRTGAVTSGLLPRPRRLRGPSRRPRRLTCRCSPGASSEPSRRSTPLRPRGIGSAGGPPSTVSLAEASAWNGICSSASRHLTHSLRVRSNGPRWAQEAGLNGGTFAALVAGNVG